MSKSQTVNCPFHHLLVAYPCRSQAQHVLKYVCAGDLPPNRGSTVPRPMEHVGRSQGTPMLGDVYSYVMNVCM